jgi:S1-C subfamily serine protease
VGPGSPYEAADGDFGFNSGGSGGTLVGRSGQEVEAGKVVLMACAKRRRGGGEKMEQQRWAVPFVNRHVDVGDILADGTTRRQCGGGVFGDGHAATARAARGR